MKPSLCFPLLAASLLSGCAVVPHVRPEVAPLASRSLGLGAGSAQIATQWWIAFGDPQLDRLIALGISSNPSLEMALARLRAAQAEIGIAHAGQLPQVNGTAVLNRTHIGDKLLPEPLGGHTENLAVAGASLSWDLDLFGRQRAMVRQATAGAHAASLDVDAAKLAISVSVAQAYVGLARADALITVADGFVATRQHSLTLVQSRVRNNLASQFDVQSAQTLLAEAEQARTRAARDRDILVHALAALVGRGADFYPEIRSPALVLNAAPAVPELIPADLLGRRPDLLAGRARIDAAMAGRKAAAAAFMLDVNITALAGLASFGLGNFLTAGAGSWGGGPALSLPIFEGGRLKAQYKGATADLDASVADYNGMVLGAVREAADSITQVRSADEDLAEQGRVVAGLRNTVRLDQVRVSTGLGSQLDAIDSGFRLLEAEQALVGLQADALTRRVQLVAALGGGFSPPSPREAAPAKDARS